MKIKDLLSIIGLLTLFSPINLFAQSMYGMVSMDKPGENGKIYRVDSSGQNFEEVYSFTSENEGALPYYSNPCEVNGKLYGTTNSGGNTFERGTLYEYDLATEEHTVITAFNFGNGSNPSSDPIVAKSGKVYGLTSRGGIGNRGALYELDIASKQVILKASISELSNAESFPQGQLTEVGTDVFYGTVDQGGANSKGAIFKYHVNGDSLTTVHSFSSPHTNYVQPCRSLVLANNGKLYGTTYRGGVNNNGTLFEIDTLTLQHKVLFEFGATSGVVYPNGGLVQHANGHLYGTCEGLVGGYIFEYDITADSLTKKMGFGTTSGSKPSGLLHLGSDGKLYGHNISSGTYNQGSLFQYDPVSGQIDILHHFQSIHGKLAIGTPIMASNGHLYGTTQQGGTSGRGMFYEYQLGVGFETKFHFRDIQNGGYPTSGLCQASDKLLYGMTPAGGVHGVGVLFSFNPKDSSYVKLHDFIDSTGSTPHGSLIEGLDGNLYGMTSGGGKPIGGSGTLFKFDISTGKYSKLVSIDNSTSGFSPNGELLQASNGKLYGLIGTINKNTLFEYTIGEDTLKTLHYFDAATGRYTYGSLTQSINGNLYGLTRLGGANDNGVIFEYDLSSEQYTALFDFDRTVTGGYPYGSLLEATNGLFYGFTSSGGGEGRGSFFSYEPSSDSFRVISFDQSLLKSSPYANFIEALDGNLYSYTAAGILQYNIAEDTVILTSHFNSSFSPSYGGLVQYFENGAPCNINSDVTQAENTLTSLETNGQYQWIDCSDFTNISGENEKTFEASNNGEYAVIVSNAFCSDTSECHEVVSLGLKNVGNDQMTKLFPNPTKNSFQISNELNVYRVALYSVSGECVLETEGHHINISGLQNGMYFVKITTHDTTEKIYTKVLKQ